MVELSLIHQDESGMNFSFSEMNRVSENPGTLASIHKGTYSQGSQQNIESIPGVTVDLAQILRNKQAQQESYLGETEDLLRSPQQESFLVEDVHQTSSQELYMTAVDEECNVDSNSSSHTKTSVLLQS